MAAQYQREDLLKAGREGFAILDEMSGRRPKISSPPPLTHPTRTPHFHHHHHHHRGHQYEYYDQQQSYYVYHGPRVVTVIREPVIGSYQAAQLYGGTVTIEYASKDDTASKDLDFMVGVLGLGGWVLDGQVEIRNYKKVKFRGPFQRANELKINNIICFRKAQNEPYKCYEDSVFYNGLQNIQFWPSSLLREDMSWTKAGHHGLDESYHTELRGPLQRPYGVGFAIIIYFRKAPDKPYICYEDFVFYNKLQYA